MWSNSTDTILHVEVVDKPQQLQSTGKHALVVCTAKEVSQSSRHHPLSSDQLQPVVG